jgi:hypothetical protein
MSPRRIAASAGLAALDLARNRMALALLVAAPAVLFAVVYVTTGERDIAFQLSTAGPEPVTGSERQLSLLFIALTAISGVSAFLAFLLVMAPLATDRRLVFEGYRPAELLLAKLLVMAGVAVLVAAYVRLLLPLFAAPPRTGGLFPGLLLGSLVYAALGLALGALVRRELEGMLVILLLVNIDAGWLQNPVFYAHAHQQHLIRLLPAHYPGQVVMASAFSDAAIGRAILLSAAVVAGVVIVAGMLYAARVRVSR